MTPETILAVQGPLTVSMCGWGIGQANANNWLASFRVNLKGSPRVPTLVERNGDLCVSAEPMRGDPKTADTFVTSLQRAIGTIPPDYRKPAEGYPLPATGGTWALHMTSRPNDYARSFFQETNGRLIDIHHSPQDRRVEIDIGFGSLETAHLLQRLTITEHGSYTSSYTFFADTFETAQRLFRSEKSPLQLAIDIANLILKSGQYAAGLITSFDLLGLETRGEKSIHVTVENETLKLPKETQPWEKFVLYSAEAVDDPHPEWEGQRKALLEISHFFPPWSNQFPSGFQVILRPPLAKGFFALVEPLRNNFWTPVLGSLRQSSISSETT